VNVRPISLLGALLVSCTCGKKDAPPPSASVAQSAAALPAPTAAPTAQPVRKPTGPRFPILMGQSVGPIFPGATVATIERHMQAKCPELTDAKCRYVDRGIEFELDEKRVLKRIKIHRVGRAAGNGQTWGPFHGAIPPDLLFGMLPFAVQEHLGKPQKVVQGNAGAHPEAVEQHYYPKTVLEYDRMPNGQLVFGGVRLPEAN
jgi:hypothetical protein